jgi:hypothetical protein
MVRFAVPEYHDVSHVVLGLLLDRANLEHVHLDGGHELTISLACEDVAVLQELGVFEGQCEDLTDEEPMPDDRLGTARREFEAKLAELQLRADRTLARVRMAA